MFVPHSRAVPLHSKWTDADADLLDRLADQGLLAGLWKRLGGGKAPPDSAAGLISCIRVWAEVDSESGRLASKVLEASRAGDFGPMLEGLGLKDMVDADTRDQILPDLGVLLSPEHSTRGEQEERLPELTHHLVLLLERSARVHAARNAFERSFAFRRQALMLRFRLSTQDTYLGDLIAAISGTSMKPAETRAETFQFSVEIIERLGREAQDTLGALEERGMLALKLLEQCADLSEVSGAGPKFVDKVRRFAEAERDRVIDAGIEGLDLALLEADRRQASTDELTEELERGQRLWIWAARDEAIERALVVAITPLCWEAYRSRRYDDVRALLRPIVAPSVVLAERIKSDASRLAYAAPCAQIFVFRAEVASTFEQQLQLAEEAVSLCPTHRNGSHVLADLLLERAARAIDGASFLDRNSRLNSAVRDVSRARGLFPQLEKIESLEARLLAFGRRLPEPEETR